MFAALAKRVFGSANDRFIKGLGKTVQAINALEPELQTLSDDELRRPDRRAARAPGKGRDPRRHPARGLRHGARGGACACSASAISTSR